MALHIRDFDAITFDIYGTLIDWEPAIINFLRKWSRSHGIDRQDADLLMAFDGARAEIQRERPAHLYPEVLRRCFDRLCREFEVEPDDEERNRFARGAAHLACFRRQSRWSRCSSATREDRGVEQYRQRITSIFVRDARFQI